jgi:hypothetical protein
VIEKELSTAGWVILISNVVSDAKTAMSIYRDKDVATRMSLKNASCELKTALILGACVYIATKARTIKCSIKCS